MDVPTAKAITTVNKAPTNVLECKSTVPPVFAANGSSMSQITTMFLTRTAPNQDVGLSARRSVDMIAPKMGFMLLFKPATTLRGSTSSAWSMDHCQSHTNMAFTSSNLQYGSPKPTLFRMT